MFPCPNPGAPLSLNKIVDRMEADPAFARFIKGLLADSYTDAAARACLVSYFNPSAADLTNLCIPEGCQKKMLFCTVVNLTTTTNLLIVGAAHRYSKKR